MPYVGHIFTPLLAKHAEKGLLSDILDSVIPPGTVLWEFFNS